MHPTIHRLAVCLGLILMLAATLPATAAEPIGQVEKLRGPASAQTPGEPERELEVGAKVFAGDRIRTGRRANVRIVFSDGTVLDLGAEADVALGEYLYDPPSESFSFSTRIFKGVFRFVTGLIARSEPEAVKVHMNVGTIGLRGTQFAGEAEETSARVILMEREEEGGPRVIDVFNEFGRVTIEEPGFGTEIPDEFSPPSPPRRMRLRTVEDLMRTIQRLQRMQVPRPLMQ